MPSRGLHRATGDEVIGTPDVVRPRTPRKRRSHRDDLGHILRAPLGELAREQAAETPAHQRYGLPVPRGEVGEPHLKPLEAVLGRAPVETQAPALDPVPRRLKPT